MALITKDDIEKIQDSISKAKSDVKKMNSDLEQKSKDTADLDKQKDDIAIEIKENETQVTHFVKEKKERADALTLADANFKKAGDNLTDANDKAKQAGDELDRAGGELDKAKDDEDKKNTQYEEALEIVDKLQEIIDNGEPGQEEYDVAIDQINAAKSDRDDALTMKEQAGADLALKEDDLRSKEDDFKSKKDAESKAEKDNDEAKDNFSEAKKNFNDSESDLAEAETQLAENSDKFISISKKINEENNEIDSIRVDVKVKEEEIEDLQSGRLIREYDAQVQERLEFAAEITKEESRSKNILFGRVEEEDFTASESDNDIIRESILEGLGVGEEGYSINKIDNIIGSIKDGAFKASAAYEMAENAVFSIEEITDEIKAQAAKGNLSMKINGAKLTATKALAIMDLGYKVTYEKIKKAKGRSSLEFTISWGYVNQGS